MIHDDDDGPSADGIVINMVVGGEVVTLKGIEESCGIVIAEMPINVRALSLSVTLYFLTSVGHLLLLSTDI